MSGEDIAAISESLGGKLRRSRGAVTLEVPPERIVAACKAVSSLPGFYHLSTVTGLDAGTAITVMYHFWKGQTFVTVETSVPKSNPKLPSVGGELPSAVLYEAEVMDLLGVTFEGNPLAGNHLILPDVYPPDAPPPLTKEADPEKIRRMMELE